MVEKFSLDKQIYSKASYLFEDAFSNFLFNYHEIVPVKLVVCDSLVNEIPSKTNVGIRSYKSLY